MSSDRYSTQKSSHDILRTRSYNDRQDDRKKHQRIRIYIQNPERDADAASISSETEFERLKQLYYQECRPINKNLLKRCGGQYESSPYKPDVMKCTTLHPHSQDRGRSYQEVRNELSPRRCHHCCHRHRRS